MNYTLVTSTSNSTSDLESSLWRADVTGDAATWTIASSRMSDAGSYRCADEREETIGPTLQLIVIGEYH